MTVRQLEKMCRKIKDKDLMVMMDSGDGVLLSVCAENSQVVELSVTEDEDLDIDDIDIEDTDIIEMLLLVPCNHECELEVGEVNSQPELN